MRSAVKTAAAVGILLAAVAPAAAGENASGGNKRGAVPRPGADRCPKITGGLSGAYHQYFATPAWNADGTKILVTRKSPRAHGGHVKKAWIVADRGDGTFGKPREIDVPGWHFFLQWDSVRPLRLFFARTDSGKGVTRLYAYDAAAMKIGNGARPLIAFRHPAGTRAVPQLAEPHPDGEHILFTPREDGNGDVIIFSLRHPENPKYRIPLDSLSYLHDWKEPATGAAVSGGDRYDFFDDEKHTCHRMRFTHHRDLSVWFKEEQGRPAKITWILYPRDRTLALVSAAGGHHTCNPAGTRLAYNRDKMYILARNADRLWRRVGVVGGIKGACHNHWSPNPLRNFIAVDGAPHTRLAGRIWIVEPQRGYRLIPVCRHDSTCASQKTHPHVTVAWGGHKIAFNSDHGNPRDVPDVYVVNLAVTPAPWPPRRGP